MTQLHRDFLAAMAALGLDGGALPTAVFHRARAALRFAIGEGEVYLPNTGEDGRLEADPAYVAGALHRAKTLLAALPAPPDLLRMDRDPDGETVPFARLGLPEPMERVREERLDEDGDAFVQEHCYWRLPGGLSLDRLLEEIVRADIGGRTGLASSVYLVDTARPLLYHLYDDRGADIAAAEAGQLLPLYRDFAPWLLEGEREKMDGLFLGRE